MHEWFEKWFNSENYLLVYDHRDENDAVELNRLIINETKLRPGSKILDAACGAGRHSIIFARQGFDVTGFDLSENLLIKAREKATAENLSVKFVKGDMRNFRPGSDYDMITNLFTSFGYFESDKENFLFVKNVYHNLNESGFYVFDYFNCNYLRKNLVPFSERVIDGILIKEKREIVEDRVDKEIVISQDGDENIFHESVKLYTFEEVLRNFQDIGYKLEKVYGNYMGGDFHTDNSPRMIAIFRK